MDVKVVVLDEYTIDTFVSLVPVSNWYNKLLFAVDKLLEYTAVSFVSFNTYDVGALLVDVFDVEFTNKLQ